MGLNGTPSGDRIHIAFFGRRNAGKSSLVNAVTGQELSVVSDVMGTTTDPVYKAMEFLPIGPVMMIDTPGFDDVGELGQKRVVKTRQVLNKTDVAVVVMDAAVGETAADTALLALIGEKGIPCVRVYNKADAAPAALPEDAVAVSALTGQGVDVLKAEIVRAAGTEPSEVRLVGDLIGPSEVVVLVIPIDEAAPKGRIILPQQQVLRDLLDVGAVTVVIREDGLRQTLESLRIPPRLVITDSQVFGMVSKVVPPEVPMTSFSILMARYKGFLETAVRGVSAVRHLRDGDRVLIAEGCTHHRQCNDIGTVKIPRWLRAHTGKDVQIHTVSGVEFPEDLSSYAMVIHCGGCMLNPREVKYRMKCAVEQGVPFVNYGILIAFMHGILKRSLAPFPHLADMIEEGETVDFPNLQFRN